MEGRETLGMTEEELQDYFEELLRAHAEQVAAEAGTTPAEEMASPGFAAARAAMSYGIRLIAANNAYLTRHLLDLGALPVASAPDRPGSDNAAEAPG